MPHPVNSSVSMLLAGSLAVAAWLGSTGVASAADECFEKPGREAGAGHWYYYSDRVHHRRCWFFEPSKTTAGPRESAQQTPAPSADPDQSWFSRFTAGLAQPFSQEPKQNSISGSSAQSSQNGIPSQNSISSFSSDQPQNGISDNPGSATKTASPRRPKSNKIAKREQQQVLPPPTTNGLGGAEQRDQLPPQRTSEKDEKQAPPLSAAEHQQLFEDFLKWYRDRSIFGRP
jgi:hypothetical protein